MTRLVAFAAMALVWGLTWMPMKLASAEVPPILLAAVRFILAGLCFFVWALVARLPLRPVQPGRLIVATLLITVVCYAFVFWGVAHAPTGLAAIVNLSLIPVFTILVGAAAGEEAITGRRIAAIGLGIVGLVALFAERMGRVGDTAVVWGLASVVVGTLGYASGAVISRPLTRAMSPIVLACYETFFGGLVLLPVSLAVEGFDPSHLLALTRGAPLFGLLFLVFGGSLTGFSIYLWLVRDWGPFRAGLYAFVSPAVAVAVGVIVQGEHFGPAEAVGMLVMFAATALVVRPEKALAAPAGR